MQNFLSGCETEHAHDRWIWKHFNGNETSQRKAAGAWEDYPRWGIRVNVLVCHELTWATALGVDPDEEWEGMWKCGVSEVAISTIILRQRMDRDEICGWLRRWSSMQFSFLGNYCDPDRSPSSIKDERVGYRSVSWLDWAGFFERSLWFDDSYIHLYPVTLPLEKGGWSLHSYEKQIFIGGNAHHQQWISGWWKMIGKTWKVDQCPIGPHTVFLDFIMNPWKQQLVTPP